MVVTALLAIVALRDLLWQGPPWRRLLTGACLVALPAELAYQQLQLRAIEQQWPAVRETAIRRASARLAGELHAALVRADRLAEAGASAAGEDRRTAFAQLHASLPRGGDESGVVILEPDGAPWAWAGRHRLMPVISADSLAIGSDGWHLELQVRRHGDGRPPGDGERTALGRLPDRGRGTFAVRPLRDGDRGRPATHPARFSCTLLRSVRLRRTHDCRIAPLVHCLPGAALAGRGQGGPARPGSCRVGWLLLVGTILALLAAGDAVPRLIILVGPLWLVLRAPIAEGYGVSEIFSPSTYYSPVLGPLTQSAGALLLGGLVVTMAGIALWHRRPQRRAWGVALAVVLLLGAPYLDQRARQRHHAAGHRGPIRLWLAWQLALVFAACSMIVLAAALLRGSDPDSAILAPGGTGCPDRRRSGDRRPGHLAASRRVAGVVSVPLDSGAVSGDPADSAMGHRSRASPS